MKPGMLRAAVPALLCALVLLCAAFYFTHDSETPVVALPSSPGTSDSLHSTEDLGQGRYTAAAVTPETVQAVVSTLERAGSYTRSVTVERFWSGGGSTERIDCHVREGDSHFVVTGSGEARHVLILGDSLYIWYGGNSRSYSGGSLAASEAGNVADEFSGILTYEELLSLDPSQISGAGYTVQGGEGCIWAEYRYGPLGYTSRVVVSISTGLLMSAERYDGDSLIYRMSSEAPVVGVPAESWFTAPS